jgi:NADPH-dependent glutamate synthase beta subunit-like oxidoreductase/Pyruvate/2-oxoacid:ferredoxin oxidoreductase delta subunit
MTDKIILTTLGDYPEAPVSEGGMLWNQTGSWRFASPLFSPRPSPCSRACPLENDIPEIMRRLAEGDIEGAAEALAWEDPFPALLGRVCPGFCMADCNRGSFDERISIRDIERFLGDRFLKQGPPVSAARTGKSIAIVGSGPAGLSAAYFLTLLGHAVSIFEKEKHPGGTPRLGIPPYRLSKRALDAVLGGMRAMGVVINSGKEIRKEDVADMSTSHDALFVAPGAHVAAAMGIEGENLPGVRRGLAFLRDVNGGIIKSMSGDYLVIGGGNTALDTARSLLRLGGRPTVVYRRGQGEMPAFADEVREALEENIPIEFFSAPVKIERAPRERLLVSLISMRPGDPDDSGRRRPLPVAGSAHIVEVDGVLSAVGETIDPELIENKNTGGRGGRVIIGGDAAGGPRTVAHAAASGKRAALRIDRMLSGRETGPGESVTGSFRAYREGRSVIPTDPVRLEELNTDYFDRTASVAAKKVPPEVRVRNFSEITRTYSEKAAVTESGRCFICGSCVGCEVCATFCPDFSISVGGDSASIDYTYCKGCGICIRECPRGVIVTRQESE